MTFYKQMGEPSELAEEFNSNLETEKDFYGILIEIPYSKIKAYEYKSNLNVFWLPLLHINTGGAYMSNTAKGVIVIGDKAIGLIKVFGEVAHLIN